MSGGIKGNKFIQKFAVVFSAALFTVLLTQDYLFTFSQLKELELKLIDQRFLKRGKIDIEDSSKVLIVNITQELFDQIPPPYNTSPFPRFIYAKAIENLTKAGVKAIGIDVEMAGPDRFSPSNDTLLMRAIRESGKVVLAGKIDETTEGLIDQRKSNVTKIFEDYGNMFYGVDSSIGIVQPPPDFDKVFRRYLPFRYTDITQERIPSFGFALLNKYYGFKSNRTAERKNGFFLLGGKKIPQYDATTVLINFYGSSGTFPHVKLIDVIDDKSFKTIDEIDSGDINTWDDPGYGLLQSGKFKDKIVIIGSTMPEDRDMLACSFAEGKHKGDNLIYGVEFHANIIQNILNNDFLFNQSKGSELFAIFFLTFISFYISSFIRKIKIKIGFLVEVLNVVFIILLVFGIYELSIILFIQNKLVIAIVSPSVAVIIGYFSSTAYHFLRERQQNVLIKGMFSQYVSKHVVNELLSNPEKLRLGGERKNVTVLFSDIAGFTSFAENKQPEELVSFINEYLNEMTEIVLANEGTLDKYLGDAVMAFWGAPIEVENHAYKACLSALQMQTKLAEMREKWSKSGEIPIRIRIGINSGDVIVGNIGGVKRFDYTVLGDDVNLASRLEGANKEYGTNIMIGESTHEKCKDKILSRQLDVIRVKGKSKPTKVYELISVVGDKKAETAIEEMDLYFQAIDLYRQRSFDSAQDYFKRSFEKLGDYPSKVYMQRCEFYLKNPPSENWDGVFEMKSK
ncbi:MAG: adenylate/guanylate cyclase domain-containing protein [Ignavibacteriales bacterium]|nr:adenylate/guanylate cyclase domain-containing protein [Ignavibacteriales bacterium]